MENEISYDEYNEFLVKAADFVTTYHTPNWISNLSELSERDEEKLNIFRAKIRSRLKQDGLKRIAVIMPRAKYPDYEQRKSVMKTAYDAELEFFETFVEAKDWIVEQNKIS